MSGPRSISFFGSAVRNARHSAHNAAVADAWERYARNLEKERDRSHKEIYKGIRIIKENRQLIHSLQQEVSQLKARVQAESQARAEAERKLKEQVIHSKVFVAQRDALLENKEISREELREMGLKMHNELTSKETK